MCDEYWDTQVKVCQVLGLVRVRGRGLCRTACCRSIGDGCGVTAQTSLPATDKAARHRRWLIPSLQNY